MLLFAASLRSASLNGRLATLAAEVVEENGRAVDRGTMAEFDCLSYDGDLKAESGIPAGAERFRDRLRERGSGTERVEMAE